LIRDPASQKKLFNLGTNQRARLATTVYGGDIGYDVLLVEDACTGTTKENHDAVVRFARDVFLKVKSTDELLHTL